MSICSSTSVSISPNIASSMTYTIQPSGLYLAGSIWTVQPIVQVLDAYGNLISGNVVLLEPFLSSDCDTRPSQRALMNNMAYIMDGYANFTSLSYNRVDELYLKASLPGELF